MKIDTKIDNSTIYKNIITKFINILLKIYYIFPVNKKSIVFISYGGKQFSCNPKYISEYINEHYKNEYNLIWAISDINKFKYLEKKGYKIVRYNTLKYFFVVITSKVIITNTSISSYIPIRKSQFVINTWHGGGAYKKVSLKDDNKISQLIKNMYSQNTKLYLSSCNKFSNLIIKDTFGYNGEIMELGMPRNDIFFKDNLDIKEKVKKYYNINNKNILLYAPTFRNAKYDYKFKFNEVLECLEKKFGGEWILFMRLHHNTNIDLSISENNKKIIDVSDYPDMQEILYTSDILITDYSSSIWDFSLMKKPCFLYVPDVDSYKIERNFYVDIENWHFPLCKNNQEILDCINKYNEYNFKKNIDLHQKEWGSYETGKSTEKVVERILIEVS